MDIKKGSIYFYKSDMAFLKKFGVEEASRMVLDFRTHNANFPFVFDTYQLSSFLGLGRKKLFDLVKNCDSHYREITLKKKNGKSRIIHAPDSALKAVQRKILDEILVKLPASPYATAYVKGKSLTENAAPHVGKRYLLKLDITDFFGSICFAEVYSAAFNTKYFPKQIGAMLTTLCCRMDVLPQGAPTSPALSNLVMRDFDDNIGCWCNKRGIAYTRYCDDMTFSSDKPLFAVYQKVKSMLEERGFDLNEQKTHFLTNATRQSVTGLTVNEKVTVAKEYKRKLRQEVYYALKFGLTNSLQFSQQNGLSDSLKDSSLVSEETHHYFNCLVGKLRYVLQIEPDNAWFRDALAQLERLGHWLPWDE